MSGISKGLPDAPSSGQSFAEQECSDFPEELGALLGLTSKGAFPSEKSAFFGSVTRPFPWKSGWPIPGMSKVGLDGLGATWARGKCWDYNKIPFKIPSNPILPVILGSPPSLNREFHFLKNPPTPNQFFLAEPVFHEKSWICHLGTATAPAAPHQSQHRRLPSGNVWLMNNGKGIVWDLGSGAGRKATVSSIPGFRRSIGRAP